MTCFRLRAYSVVLPPDEGVVVHTPYGETDEGPRLQGDPVYLQGVPQLPGYVRHGGCVAQGLLDTRRQVRQAVQVIPGNIDGLER